MSLYKLLIILFGLVVCTHVNTIAQKLDSLKLDREGKLMEYSEFKNSMTERTWVNLIELGKRAEAVIDADNDLILTHLEKEINHYREISKKHETLNMELALTQSESSKNNTQIEEYKQLNNVLLLVVAILLIILFSTLILLSNIYRKSNQTTFELEKFWSMRDELSMVHKDKEKELTKQLRLLEIENKAMHKEFTLLSDQKIAAKKKLDQEIQSRQKVEREIKGLIGQLKRN